MVEKSSKFIPSKEGRARWLWSTSYTSGKFDIRKTEVERIPPYSDFLTEQLISHAEADQLEKAIGNTQTDEMVVKKFRSLRRKRRILYERKHGGWGGERMFSLDDF